MKVLLRILGLLFLTAAVQLPAQNGSAEDWLESQKDGVVTRSHKSGTSIIIAGAPISDRDAPAINVFAARFDRPELCPGLSRATIEPTLGGRGRMLRTTGAINCTLLAGSNNGLSQFVVVIEQRGSLANGAVKGQRELARLLGPAATPPFAKPVEAPSTAAKRPATPGSSRSLPPRGLIGMWRADWVTNEYMYPSGLTLVAKNETLILTEGGYFMTGTSRYGFNDAAAQRMIREEPGTAGRYSASAGLITLAFADGSKETVGARRSGNGWTLTFRSRILSPKLTFPDGAVLSGNYSANRITNAGGGTFVMGDDDYSFAANGRFAKGSRVSMASSAVSSVGSRSGRTGRYLISGGAIELIYDDGTRESYALFQETPNAEIWLNEEMLTPVH